MKERTIAQASAHDTGMTAQGMHRAGAVAMSGFAFLWALTGASGFGGMAGGIVIAVASVVTVLVLWSTRAVRGTDARVAAGLPDDWSRRFNRIGAVQAAAIVGAVVVLGRLDAPGYVPPVVCAIVGLHFLPLAHLFDQSRFRWTAGALLVVAAVGAGVAPMTGDGPVRSLVGLGAAAVLWLSALPDPRRDRP